MRFNQGRPFLITILTLSVAILATAQESRNKLPKQQHKNSDAPFLKPEEAVEKIAGPADSNGPSSSLSPTKNNHVQIDRQLVAGPR